MGASDPNASSRPRTVKRLFTLVRKALEAGNTRVAGHLVDELERLLGPEGGRLRAGGLMSQA
jgi:hypothetical protein